MSSSGRYFSLEELAEIRASVGEAKRKLGETRESKLLQIELAKKYAELTAAIREKLKWDRRFQHE